MLTKRFQQHEEVKCNIDIDNLDIRKREQSLLTKRLTSLWTSLKNGMDGKVLKEWLSQNRHVEAVTYDWTSFYVSAIQEILLDVMQIADRFHLP